MLNIIQFSLQVQNVHSSYKDHCPKLIYCILYSIPYQAHCQQISSDQLRQFFLGFMEIKKSPKNKRKSQSGIYCELQSNDKKMDQARFLHKLVLYYDFLTSFGRCTLLQYLRPKDLFCYIRHNIMQRLKNRKMYKAAQSEPHVELTDNVYKMTESFTSLHETNTSID